MAFVSVAIPWPVWHTPRLIVCVSTGSRAHVTDWTLGSPRATIPGMDADDELCLCFHVSRRKLENFVRVESPRRASQLAECFGAGTGCGWCRPFLQQLFEQSQSGEPTETLTPAEYARRRASYIRAGGGTPPPGAEQSRQTITSEIDVGLPRDC